MATNLLCVPGVRPSCGALGLPDRVGLFADQSKGIPSSAKAQTRLCGLSLAKPTYVKRVGDMATLQPLQSAED